MSTSRRWLAALLAAALPAVVPAQEQDSSQSGTAALMKILRDRRLGSQGRKAVVKRLCARGEEGATALHSYAYPEYKARYKDYVEARDRYRKVFDHGARKLFEARQDGQTKKRIEELQDKARKLSAGELTKDLIHDQIDPLCDELEEILVLSVEQIVAERPEVAESGRELQAELRKLTEAHDMVKQAVTVLETSPEGKRFLSHKDAVADPAGYAAELARELAWMAVLARPMSKRDESTLVANRALRGELDPQEYDGILDLNLLRLRLGRALFKIDVKLCNAARGHSEDMRRLGFFSHTSKVPGKETPGKRAALAGTSAGAENIARGASTGPGAIRQWWYSPGHHKNMMRGGGRIGLGRSEAFWTQMFGG